jgi:hypothetical protein
MLLGAALLASVATLAFAAGDEAPPMPDPERPAIGEWLGEVSWNELSVTYAWRIDPDGTFSSGRAGRGLDGGGTWGTHGARLTLKYENGFRYEGELRDDAYSGTAYLANGRALGGFAMWRATERPSDVGEAP